MSTTQTPARQVAALALALGVTAVVHLGVWECAAANARQVARASQADRAAPAPAVTIAALGVAGLPRAHTA